MDYGDEIYYQTQMNEAYKQHETRMAINENYSYTKCYWCKETVKTETTTRIDGEDYCERCVEAIAQNMGGCDEGTH